MGGSSNPLPQPPSLAAECDTKWKVSLPGEVPGDTSWVTALGGGGEGWHTGTKEPYAHSTDCVGWGCEIFSRLLFLRWEVRRTSGSRTRGSLPSSGGGGGVRRGGFCHLFCMGLQLHVSPGKPGGGVLVPLPHILRAAPKGIPAVPRG